MVRPITSPSGLTREILRVRIDPELLDWAKENGINLSQTLEKKVLDLFLADGQTFNHKNNLHGGRSEI